MTSKPKSFANTAPFYSALGLFYATWSRMEITVDFAICKLLKITPERTHALVAGLQFGPKAALLRSLLTLSDWENEADLKGYLTRITKESRRNVFTHSFLASDAESVMFIHRQNQTTYSCVGYKFEADNFLAHVQSFVELTYDFEKALGFSRDEVAKFAAAAIKEEKSE